MSCWWEDGSIGFGAVVEDGIAASDDWTLAGFELHVVLRLGGLFEGGEQDIIALTGADLEVGCVEGLGV